ncbi:hypothetical protein I541_5723 [Mycobacteroides abscessus]|nr:hypothetical protein I541_5723 [Mycobacteroides abscessus]
MAPLPALCDRLERHLYQLPRPDRTQTVAGQRPKCAAVVKTTGQDCTNSAIYLGSGMFGAHCYSHATAAEREQYRDHHERNDALQARSHTRPAQTCSARSARRSLLTGLLPASNACNGSTISCSTE